MIVAAPVTPDEQVDPRWGKASRVVIARIEAGEILGWEVHQTDWDRLHDEGTHGSHHARIVGFLRDHKVEAVVLNHAGPPMMNTMSRMGLAITTDAHGPAREAVLRATGSRQP